MVGIVLESVVSVLTEGIVTEGIGIVTSKVKEVIEKKKAVPIIQLTGEIKRNQEFAALLDGEVTYDLGGDIDSDSLEVYDTITLNFKNVGNCAVKKIGINGILVYLASEDGFEQDLERGCAEYFLLFKDTSSCKNKQQEISLKPGEEKCINLVFAEDDFKADKDNGEIGETVFVSLALDIDADNGSYEQDAVCCTYEDQKAVKTYVGDVNKKK